VSFGSGRHFCVGAGLIRMVATALTAPLVRRFASAELSQPVEWKGGAGFLAPKALVVSLTAVEQDPR
jgi:cytochrome P450